MSDLVGSYAELAHWIGRWAWAGLLASLVPLIPLGWYEGYLRRAALATLRTSDPATWRALAEDPVQPGSVSGSYRRMLDWLLRSDGAGDARLARAIRWYRSCRSLNRVLLIVALLSMYAHYRFG